MTPSTLSSRTIAAYATAVGPVAILSLPFSVFLPPFIAQGGAVAVGMVGIIFTIATIWDGVVDPAIGNMIDRASHGAKPHLRWMYLASPPVMVLLAILAFWGDALPLYPCCWCWFYSPHR